jgi:hypothetical protein
MSRSSSFHAELVNKAATAEESGYDEFPSADWESDPLAQVVIGGTAFGVGLFELIFSLLPYMTSICPCFVLCS